MAAVYFDGFLTGAKLERYLFIEHSADHQGHHFLLSGRELLQTQAQLVE